MDNQPKLLGTGSAAPVSTHASGIQRAFGLQWANGVQTQFYGGGKSHKGGWHVSEKVPDLVITAVEDDSSLGKVNRSDMSCAEFLTGIRMIRLDWPDFGAPYVGRQFWIALLGDIAKLGIKHVHCQCAGGNGRTGTMLSVIYQLATSKFKTVAELVAYIRSQYRDEAVESSSQFDYIAFVCGIEKGNVAELLPKKAAYVTTTYGSSGDMHGGDKEWAEFDNKHTKTMQLAQAKKVFEVHKAYGDQFKMIPNGSNIGPSFANVPNEFVMTNWSGYHKEIEVFPYVPMTAMKIEKGKHFNAPKADKKTGAQADGEPSVDDEFGDDFDDELWGDINTLAQGGDIKINENSPVYAEAIALSKGTGMSIEAAYQAIVKGEM